MLVPAETRKDIVAKLHTAIATLLQTPQVRQRFAEEGLEPLTTTPAEFAALITSDTAKWAKLIRGAGIRID